jgi:hypothetical protein
MLREAIGIYLASLSISSPKPGVSTIVREMRVPSSSSSSSVQDISICPRLEALAETARHTDSDGLDLDTLLGSSIADIVALLVLEDVLAAERVDECGSA